jgi:pimeloyl-ACP methyl ester carboxylesterase
MSFFVLVHGSGQNARCWDRVTQHLTARGHRVAAPDLLKNADLRLADHAARIADAIDGPGAVVVAHSLCGVFLPLVAQIRHCALLVFVAAVIPEPGKSVREQFEADSSMFNPSWIEAGPRWFDPIERESLAREFLFHDCDEATISWALPTLEPMNTRDLVVEPSPFATWPNVPTTSIVATEDRTLTVDWGRRTSLRVLGHDALEVRSGHCPQVSQPSWLADTLDTLVDGLERPQPDSSPS